MKGNSKYVNLVALVVLVLLISSSVEAQPTKVLGARYPQISPDGSEVLFSYNGDLWTVPTGGGDASRLTDNTAYERNGVWSPDGEYVAFTSNRRGNYDVFVMPADGGTPTQLTFADSDDYVSDFGPGGKVLFFSRRDWRAYNMFEVDVAGGMPVRLTVDDMSGSYGCYTPSGDVIYSRGAASWYRKGYVGSGNYELWFLDRKSLKSRKITDYQGNDFFPATADGKTVYFASERDGMYNVYKTSVSGGEAAKVTDVKSDGITVPSVSKDGKTIVFENNGRLYRKPTMRGSETEIEIFISADEKENLVFKDIFSTTDEYALSPNGKYIAFTVRGDIYVTYTDDAFGEDDEPDRNLSHARRVTDHPARDWQISWHPDSDALIFASDRNEGQLDLYTADLRTMEVERLTDSPRDDIYPKYSGDGKYIAYNRGGNELVLLEPETHDSRVIASGMVMWGPFGGWFSFSPDDRWIAYSEYIDGFQDDLFIAPVAESGEPINVTRHPDWLGSFQWVPDGSGIVFTSDRSNDEFGLYFLELTREEHTFTEGFIIDEPGDENGEDEENVGGDENGEGDEKEIDVDIDFDRIWERVNRLTYQSGWVGSPLVSPDSEWVYYIADTAEGMSDLWAVSIEGGDPVRLGMGMPLFDIQLSTAGDKLYYLGSGGNIGYVEVSGNQSMGGGGVYFEAEKKVDRRKELVQMYTECWRLMREYFYDPDLHGARKDWDDIYKKYLPLVEQATTSEEFFYIVYDLLGEIKGSHLGVWGDSSFEGVPAFTGILGLDFDLAYAGPGLKVSHVLRDGPADRDESKIEKGEVVLSINGAPVDRSVNIYRILDETPGDQVDTRVRGRDGKERTVRLILVQSGVLMQLAYLEWVEERRLMAEELSNGKVGYLHIRGMNWSSLEKFQHDLFGLNFDKEAIVIDVRFNGGGHTHNYLLALLTRRAFSQSKSRHGEWVKEPAMRWERPAVVLINSSSGSDAEIFPHGFRELGLGKLVGVPTHGSVIGTGRYMLVDGSFFRLPMNGWYYPDRRNLEQAGKRGVAGVEPDIYVENNPDDVRVGKDPQLEAAVRELLKDIG